MPRIFCQKNGAVKTVGVLIREEIKGKTYEEISYPAPNSLDDVEEDIPESLKLLLQSLWKLKKRKQNFGKTEL